MSRLGGHGNCAGKRQGHWHPGDGGAWGGASAGLLTRAGVGEREFLRLLALADFDPNAQTEEDLENYGVDVEMSPEEVAKLPPGSYKVVPSSEEKREEKNDLTFKLN